MEKIVLFNRITLRFIKNASAYPGPTELFCENPDDAYDFKSVEKAKDWAEQSGFQLLATLEYIPT